MKPKKYWFDGSMKNPVFLTGICFVLCLFALLSYRGQQRRSQNNGIGTSPAPSNREVAASPTSSDHGADTSPDSSKSAKSAVTRPEHSFPDNERKPLSIGYASQKLGFGSDQGKYGHIEKFQYEVKVAGTENTEQTKATNNNENTNSTDKYKAAANSNNTEDETATSSNNTEDETATDPDNAKEERTITKTAYVYLPYGYDSTDTDTKYDVLYLMHGGGCNETWYFGEGDIKVRSSFQILLDHMIANGDVKPCIVCTPTYNNDLYAGNDTAYFPTELKNDLIPALETKYHTYYDQNDPCASRWHRCFSGFSMGAATTWWVFEKCLDEFAYYIPISGNSWCGGSDAEDSVKHLTNAVTEQGYTGQDFLIYFGCGNRFDLASDAVTAQVAAMKKDKSCFTYAKNFADGNFYYHKVKDGGHDINTVYEVLYNALPKFFGTFFTQDEYKEWMEKKMLDKLPKKLTQKRRYTEYGKLKKCHYYSRTAKRDTPVNVLLPPFYDKSRKYPVLYLLHGYFDDQNWLTDQTELVTALGNMIDTGMAEDMIVVMPYIYTNPKKKICDKIIAYGDYLEVASQLHYARRRGKNYDEMNLKNTLAYDNFVNDLTKDLMPFLEKKFAIKTGRENTAISGFSMGGRESLFIGITHPELFGYVGAVCPAPGLTPGENLSTHPGQLTEDEIDFPKDKAPFLLYLSAGKEDQTAGSYPAKIHELLNRHQVTHTWEEIEGGSHDASSVRIHLANYLQFVFRYVQE